jgi:hypothetical protein
MLVCDGLALGGLQSVRDALILARHQQYNSDTECILLFEYKLSKYYSHSGNLNCLIWILGMMELRFAKSDLVLLKRLFGILDKITYQQGTACSGIEGLCIFLKRLAYSCRYPVMAIRFSRNPSEICIISDEVLGLIYDAHHRRLCQQSRSKIVLMQYITRVPH